jgi:hypothetical protein
MADEILIGSGGGTNILQAEAAAQLILLSLADRDSSLMAHPALAYLGDAQGRNSDVLQVPIVGLDGYDTFTSLTEIQAMSNSALTTAEATVTLARWGMNWALSDMVRIVEGRGILDLGRLAQSLVRGANMTMVKGIVDLVDGASAGVSATGAKLTWAHVQQAAAQLTVAKVPAPYISVLHPVQFEHVREDLVALGGAVQWSPGAQAALSAWRGVGYQGSYNGIDFFTSSEVDTSAGDYKGGMFGFGFVGYQTGSAPSGNDGANEILRAGPIRVEMHREATAAYSKIVANMFAGFGELNDSCGRYLLSRQTL